MEVDVGGRLKRKGMCVHTKLIHFVVQQKQTHQRWSKLDEMFKERSNHTPITNEVIVK